MNNLKIYTKDDNILHVKCTECELPISDEYKKIGNQMIDYLKNSQNVEYAKSHKIRSGVGLAAPQIGIDKRFFAIYLKMQDKIYENVLYNPKIISTSVKKAYLANGEGCLSVPVDVAGHVYRYNKITIKGYDLITNSDVILKISGYPAIVYQHEYDHLDGILYYEKINKMNPFYDDSDAIKIE